MASKVNPTPTLKGANADIFVKKLKTPSTNEEIKALNRAKKTFEKIGTFHAVILLMTCCNYKSGRIRTS